MGKSAYTVAMENTRKNFNEHYQDYLDCMENKNAEGMNYHSGVMLGIAECAMDFFGEGELYSRWCAMFKQYEE